MIIQRILSKKVIHYCQIFPVVAIVGPRQAGKTTLVKELIPGINRDILYLDLERPSDLSKLDNPELYLTSHNDKCIILDEIQNKPGLFPLIRSLVDEQKNVCSFIILGSASPELLKQSSESLAGRIGYLELGPLSLTELLEIYDREKHLFSGGFPLSYLARDYSASTIWLENFIKTYLERDLPMLGLKANPVLIRRLWEMLAWQTGGLINQNALSKSLGVSNHTINNYIGYLEGAFLVIRVLPFTINLKKRMVKTPKIYIRDTGILTNLLRIVDYDQLMGNPLLGNIWETYVVNQILLVKNENINLYFYRTHAGSEIDLVFSKGLKPTCSVEIKFSSTPKLTKGFLMGINTLQTKKNYIVIPNNEDYVIGNNVRVVGLKQFITEILPTL